MEGRILGEELELEVCSVLRKIREDMKLIIISGYAEFSYAERAMEFGVLGYCLKPLDYDKTKKCW